MKRDIIWETPYTPATEHLRFTDTPGGSKQANGLIVGVLEDNPFRIQYDILIDKRWRVREVTVTDLLLNTIPVHLRADGEGHWTSRDGTVVPKLDGCIDVDFTATPFTNTLPIQRLGRQIGVTHEINVVYIVHPQFEVYTARQFYTCQSDDEQGARYHFRMDNFERNLVVDSGGFVTDYPELFRRIWKDKSDS